MQVRAAAVPAGRASVAWGLRRFFSASPPLISLSLGLFCSFVSLCGFPGHSSLTRDRTWALCNEGMES